MIAAAEAAGPAFAWLFDGPASHIWPLLAVPAAAAWIAERAARRFPPTRADWRIAGLLAATPGLAMLAIIAMILTRAVRHIDHFEDWAHFLQFPATAAIAAVWLGRGLIRAHARQHQLQRLLQLAAPPPPRLAAAAARVGLTVRLLPDEQCDMFVAGCRRSIVYVSHGALNRLNDEQLTAALHHERAHVEGRDPLLFLLLAFLRDIAPSSPRAADAFLDARERRADAVAARTAGSLALASALIAAVKPLAERRSLSLAGVSGTGSVEWRLAAILGTERSRAPAIDRRIWSGLAANLLLAGWPAAHVFIAYQLCC